MVHLPTNLPLQKKKLKVGQVIPPVPCIARAPQLLLVESIGLVKSSKHNFRQFSVFFVVDFLW